MDVIGQQRMAHVRMSNNCSFSIAVMLNACDVNVFCFYPLMSAMFLNGLNDLYCPDFLGVF